MENKRIPDVLPDGVLEPVENDDLIIAKIKYDSHKKYQGVENAVERRPENG
ncbi:hypothetical protein SDC9_187606 [bioreactor metagenome]|uniref:Uncharacterized protein n=1 Tax=bioreactor metagenome TaxID=1076179 RepID=A0A645HM11_9ZZZZ